MFELLGDPHVDGTRESLLCRAIKKAVTEPIALCRFPLGVWAGCVLSGAVSLAVVALGGDGIMAAVVIATAP